MNGNFQSGFNYKGALLEWSSKNGRPIKFIHANLFVDSQNPRFRADVLSGSNRFVGQIGRTKLEAEHKAAYAALCGVGAVTDTNVDSKFVPSKSSVVDTVSESISTAQTNESKGDPVAKMGDSTPISSLFSNSNKFGFIGDTCFKQNELVEEEEEFYKMEDDSGIFDPFKHTKATPISVLKEKLYSKYREDVTYFDKYREENFGLPYNKIIEKYNKEQPIMQNGRIAKWFKGLLIIELWNDEKKSIELARYFFGQSASASSINPILYRCKFLSSKRAPYWKLKISD